jgi:hypothetical protein
MTLGPDFERRLANDLRSELDRAMVPHPAWTESPAAARVAAARGGVRWPRRLLAVAAVLAIAGGVALAVALRPHEGIAGCPTLADYAAASAEPSPSLGEAPGVSFPPVAPDASPTVGLLPMGTWAVVVDDQGPVVQMRLRDLRECGRLPDYRSGFIGGSLVLATADVRVLRDDHDLAWLGANDTFYAWLGGTESGRGLASGGYRGLFFGVPGVDHRSRLGLREGFSSSSDVIFDLPPSALQADAYAMTLSSLAQEQGLGFGWILRPGQTGSLLGIDLNPHPSPGPTQTTGEVALGVYATLTDPAGDSILTITEVDQVSAYPGRTPSPGNVFLEARIWVWYYGGNEPGGASTWRAVDGDGRELPILTNADPSSPDRGVLQDLMPPTGTDGIGQGWFVVEAPSSGLVRLELTRDGQDQPLLSYVIRQP